MLDVQLEKDLLFIAAKASRSADIVVVRTSGDPRTPVSYLGEAVISSAGPPGSSIDSMSFSGQIADGSLTVHVIATRDGQKVEGVSTFDPKLALPGFAPCELRATDANVIKADRPTS